MLYRLRPAKLQMQRQPSTGCRNLCTSMRQLRVPSSTQTSRALHAHLFLRAHIARRVQSCSDVCRSLILRATPSTFARRQRKWCSSTRRSRRRTLRWSLTLRRVTTSGRKMKRQARTGKVCTAPQTPPTCLNVLSLAQVLPCWHATEQTLDHSLCERWGLQRVTCCGVSSAHVPEACMQLHLEVQRTTRSVHCCCLGHWPDRPHSQCTVHRNKQGVRAAAAW
jgi:hypothetical protein